MLAVIIFMVLLTVTVIAMAIARHNTSQAELSQYCNSDKDCPNSNVCIPNPQKGGKKQCFPADTTFCQITPNSALTSCTLSDPNSCSSCINTPKYSCVAVTQDKPYVWKQGQDTYNLPLSEKGKGWCLPNIVNNISTCNPFVSDTVLVDTGDGFEWGCECKYPGLFDHSEGPTSDCTLVRACGETSGLDTGMLYVPDPRNVKCQDDSPCNSGDRCLKELTGDNLPCGPTGVRRVNDSSLCSDSENCVCHTPWTGNITEQVHPLTGQCVCNKLLGLEYQCVQRATDHFEMDCVKGHCPGFDTEGNVEKCNPDKCYKDQDGNCECCSCPAGYIRCPDDIPSGNTTGLIAYCQNNGPTCIKDPCAINDSIGKWDKNASPPQCNCGGGSYGAVDDEFSPVGQVCSDLCASDPCGGRGTCVVRNGVAQCDMCISPHTNSADKTCTCASTMPGGLLDDDCCSADDCVAGLYCNNCSSDSQGCFKSIICKTQHDAPKGKCKGQYEVAPSSPCTPNADTSPTVCGGPTDGFCPHDSLCCGALDPTDPTKSKQTWKCCMNQPGGTCCLDNEYCCPEDYPVCSSAGCMSKDGTKMMCNVANPNLTDSKYKDTCKISNWIKTSSRE
jgi:hypothetical protein